MCQILNCTRNNQRAVLLFTKPDGKIDSAVLNMFRIQCFQHKNAAFTLALLGMKCNLPISAKQTPTKT